MNKRFGMLAAAALAVGGIAFVGCHDNNPDSTPAASVGGMSGGGSTDSYGTGAGARLRSTGNIGMDSGAAPSNNAATPQPAAGGERAIDNQPPQTPVIPGAAPGTTTTNNGTGAGSTGAGSNSAPRTDEVNRNRSAGSNNNGNASSGAVLGGTNGNGTTNSGAGAPPPGTSTK